MRVFLTGASGYLGGVLMEHFSAMPEVESITGIALSQPRRLPAKAVFKRMDIRSPEIASAMADHDAVVHTACVVLWPASMSVRERDDINLNGVANVARAALRLGVRRFIHTSSMAAYDPDKARGQSELTEDFPPGTGKSRFYYWNAKAHAEVVLSELLGRSSTLLTMLRPIYIVGPRNRPNVESYRKNAINFPGRNPRRQFIHEADVASAFVQALRTPMPGAFNLVPDDFLRMKDVWQIVGARRVPTVPRPMALFVTWVRWRFLRSPIHPCWVDDMLVDFTGSNSRLRATGWKPAHDSASALRSAL